MSENAALDGALAKFRRDRLRFAGLPQENAAQIFEEAIERLLLLPEAAKWEESGIGIADTGASLLLALIPGDTPFVGLEVKGLDFALHTLVSWATAKARADQAKAQESP